MSADRFTKALLVVIALELLWLGANTARPVSAQDAAMPVVITGIAMPPQDSTVASLPVLLTGAKLTLPVSVAGTVTIEPISPLAIRSDPPIKVEADRPLPVRAVPAIPAPRPGL